MQADSKAQAVWAASQAKLIPAVLTYLTTLKKDFALSQNRFRGLGKDSTAAAIDKAIADVQKALTDAKAQAQTETGKMSGEIKTQGVDIPALTKEIAALDAQLVSVYGQDKVVYTDAEKQMIDFVRQVAAHPEQLGDPEQLEQYASTLQIFKAVVQQALTKAQSKHSSLKLLSKRAALKTPGGTFRMNLPGQQEQDKEYRAPRQGAFVLEIQKALNYINATYKTGIKPIQEDQKYGPETSGALVAMMDHFGATITEQITSGAGLSRESLQDVQTVYSTPKAIENLAAILRGAYATNTQENTENKES